ncbi:MAG: hypothetical protein ACOX9R_16430 [Armatimonadota bacterium]|jgi:hypothetical protein
MSRTRRVLVVITVLLMTVGAATAQVGTWGIPSASTWAEDQSQVFGEARFFDDDNQTWGVFLRGGFDDNGEAIFGYFDWEVTGEDPISGAVRKSEMSAVVVDLKWLLRDTTPRIALRAGADLNVGRATGTNTLTGASAFMTGAIPTVSLPIEFGNPEGTLFVIEPKVVWFDTWMPTTLGAPIEGFGTAVMIGGGVRYPISNRVTLIVDAAYPINDSNSINDVTNEVTEELAWSAGISADLGSGWDADVFATTAAGPTPATSAIATPDQSIGLGVRVSKTW